jgi:hypothetical protein
LSRRVVGQQRLSPPAVARQQVPEPPSAARQEQVALRAGPQQAMPQLAYRSVAERQHQMRLH